MKNILGLDLGVASIGWALIKTDDSTANTEIVGMGSRIIPYSDKEGDEFGKGVGESINQQRTTNRTSRKTLDRYQLRRFALNTVLTQQGLAPKKDLFQLSALQLFELRAKAATQKIRQEEFGRILLHLNQKRGYKHGAGDASEDKKQRDYVEQINTRYAKIKGEKTIGQYFYEELKEHLDQRKYYRVKEQIFPREAYIEEFDTIWRRQSTEFPEKYNDELRRKIKEIIYYQRPLKSQKGLVSICEFEGFYVKDKNGKEIYTGPKTAPRSSPLFQLCKIWENINSITIKHIDPTTGKHYKFDIAPFKSLIFDYLNCNENLSEAKLFEILSINRNSGYYSDANVRKKGIQGNLTLSKILLALKDYDKKDELIKFNIEFQQTSHLNKQTGELTTITQVAAKCEQEPLYQLWHLCYSVKDKNEKIAALKKRFSLPDGYALALANIDFTAGNFGNKSAKVMRKILPALMDGEVYSTAMEAVGFNHSFSETTDVRNQRQLQPRLLLLPKNSLRQPVVEKILNQMINIVNAIIKEYGRPDEIRIELARELKQSKEERNDFFNAINQRTKQNDKIANRLQTEYGVKPTRKNIEKWRLWHEVNGRCLYCDKQILVDQFLRGIESDVEHIIPRTVFFDDSFANKTISHISCNKAKSNATAFDFMDSKGKEILGDYIQSVNRLYKNDRSDTVKTDEGVHCLAGKISKRKFERLLWKKEDIPQDFINRQLQETRYIARKAKEILNGVCRNVYSSSGNITEKLRRLWGWNDVLMNLHLKKYKEQNLTEIIEISNNGKTTQKELIPTWNKRDDHRHHAIDALIVACTKQAFIQRLNTLNTEKTRGEIKDEIKNKEFKEKLSLLERYLIAQRPLTTFQVETATAKILISYKAGKKVATIGNRKVSVAGKKEIAQSGIIVPRGALSEQSVYGRIKTIEKDYKRDEVVKYPVKYLFEHPDLIFKIKIRKLVEERLDKHGGDVKKAIASLKKDPIYLDNQKSVELKYGSCFAEEVVIKYPISSITIKDVPYIVDNGIKRLVQARLENHNNKEKEAFKEPLWYDNRNQLPILSVRMFAKLTAIEPVKVYDAPNDVYYNKYFLTKNNHHIALYKKENGELVECPATFWHCVERKTLFYKYFTENERNLIQENTVVKQPQLLWDKLLNLPDSSLPGQSFLQKLPEANWQFVTSLQRNEMFVIGLNREDLSAAVNAGNNQDINEYLFRVNAIATKNYQFRLHTETKVDDKHGGVKNEMLSKKLGKLIIIQSLDSWAKRDPIKVRINNLGKIINI